MDSACHLSVIIDLSPSQWSRSSEPQDGQSSFSLADFLPPLLVFFNAHIASQHENTLTVFGALPGKSSVLFSSEENHSQAKPDATAYQPFKTMNTAIMQKLSEELDSLSEDNDAPMALVGALTKAFCHINRLVHPPPPSDPSVAPPTPPTPRILIISVSPDLSASYIPVMNAIFCAQKLKVVIDVCKIYGPDTVFLQQAAHLTGGSYISIQHRDTLLQYLMTCFLSPPSVRKLMAVPTEDKIDFRAACFCHKTIVDVGFICSVCLSIFCKPTPVCSTCRAKFPMKTLARLKEAFKPALPNGIPDPPPVVDSPLPSPKAKQRPLKLPPNMPPGLFHPSMVPGLHPTPLKRGQQGRPMMHLPPGVPPMVWSRSVQMAPPTYNDGHN